MEWAALVIDDAPGIRQSLRLCLEVSGARVLGVATAEAALAALDRGQFDVVFLDLWLGSDSGLAALPGILRRRPGVGVIVVTAYASIETRSKRFRAFMQVPARVADADYVVLLQGESGTGRNIPHSIAFSGNALSPSRWP
jgi:DNA-binding NtrC family response regulator